jgi:HK97 family phage major capsid protein/HK97 family phage prohead protease
MIRKVYEATVERIASSESDDSEDGKVPMTCRVTMSDATPDRYGDTISHKGWDLEAFRRNPVILWGHCAGDPPIGKATSVAVKGKALVGEIEFAPTEKGVEVATLVAGGYVRAVSVGFIPIKYGPRKGADGEGIAFEEQELLECSFVSIPANPNALVEDPASKSAREEIVKSFGNGPEEEQHNEPPRAAGAQEMPENTAPVAPAEASLSETQKAQVDAIVAAKLKVALNTTATDPSAPLVAAAKSAPVEPVITGAPHIRGFHGREQVKTTDQKQIVGACAVAVAKAHQLKANPLDVLEMNGHRDLAERSEKALGVGTLSSGGLLVPEEAGAMIELMRANSAIIGAPGIRIVTMNSDKMTIPRQTGAATATYVGEQSALTATTQTFDAIVLSAKKISAMTVASNEFIRDSSVSAEMFISDDLMRSAGLKMDLTALQGTGTVYEPGGLVKHITAAHQVQQTGTTLANWITDTNRCIADLESSDIPTDGALWAFSPRTKTGLWGLQDAMGNFLFANEAERSKTFRTYGYRVTSQITIAASAASRVFFFQPSEFIVGVRGNFEIAVGEGYTTDGSTVKNAFVEDGVAIRLIGRHDFAMRHPDAGAIIHTVTLA